MNACVEAVRITQLMVLFGPTCTIVKTVAVGIDLAQAKSRGPRIRAREDGQVRAAGGADAAEIQGYGSGTRGRAGQGNRDLLSGAERAWPPDLVRESNTLLGVDNGR